MKIIVLGDTHGHESWKKILNVEKDFDKVVFLGDYWDSFSIKPRQQKEIYKDIQEFRENNPGKVVTLLGNHDYHYIYSTEYSGWKSETNFLAKPLLEDDIRRGKLPYIHIEGDIIFSHAGVTKYWLNEVAKCTLEELQLNEVQLRFFDWNSQMGSNPFGDTISNSPLWVRPRSLKEDALPNYKQVVGHTNYHQIENHKDTLYFCDTLPFEYLVIEDKEFVIKKILNEKSA